MRKTALLGFLCCSSCLEELQMTLFDVGFRSRFVSDFFVPFISLVAFVCDLILKKGNVAMSAEQEKLTIVRR
jgi:hypothetical protein